MQQGSRILNDNYCIIDAQLLGKGSTGNVYLGYERNNTQHRVAIKAINLKQIDNEVTRYLLACEIAALSNLGKMDNTSHEGIVKLFDVVISDHFIYLVTELLEGGTLAEYIKRFPNGLPEDEALFIFGQILEGYRHMRLKNIVHRDLKPDNILFRTKPELSKRVAIIDFGYCEIDEVPNKPQVYYNVGSPRYMSPEAYKDNHYSEKSDIWALGVILYELLVGKTCDHGMTMESYLQTVRKNGIPLPHNLSPFIKQLLSAMLAYIHHTRFDCNQILQQLQLYHNKQQTSLPHQRSQIIIKKSQLKDEEMRMTQPSQLLIKPNERNNMIFKSAIVNNQPVAVNNMIQRPISIVPNFSKIIEEPNQNLYDKKMMKSTSMRNAGMPAQSMINPQNRDTFGQPNHILGHVQNVDLNSTRAIFQKRQITEPSTMQYYNNATFQNSSQARQLPFHQSAIGNRVVELNQLNQSNQLHQLHHHHQVHHNHPHQQKVDFNLMAHQSAVGEPTQFKMNRGPPQNILIDRREQRFSSNTQISDNKAMKILMKSANLDRTVPNITIHPKRISIQKNNQRNAFHSPQRNPTTIARKIQFYTQKKLINPQPTRDTITFRQVIGPKSNNQLQQPRSINGFTCHPPAMNSQPFSQMLMVRQGGFIN